MESKMYANLTAFVQNEKKNYVKKQQRDRVIQKSDEKK